MRTLDSTVDDFRFAFASLSFGLSSLWRDRDSHMTYHVFWQLEIFPSWTEIAVQQFGEPGGPADPALALSTTELDWLERGLVTASFYHPCAVPRLHELRQGRARRAREFDLLIMFLVAAGTTDLWIVTVSAASRTYPFGVPGLDEFSRSIATTDSQLFRASSRPFTEQPEPVSVCSCSADGHPAELDQSAFDARSLCRFSTAASSCSSRDVSAWDRRWSREEPGREFGG